MCNVTGTVFTQLERRVLSRERKGRFGRKNSGVQFGINKVEEYMDLGHVGEELSGKHPDEKYTLGNPQ